MHAIQALDIALLRNHGSAWQYGLSPFMSRMSTQFGESDLRRAIAASNGDLIPRRLSIRIRFPTCDGTPARQRAEAYLARLYREVSLVAASFERDRQVWQVLLGIDASAFLDVGQIIETLETLRSHFRLSKDGDVAIELDPQRVARNDVRRLAEAGFTRITIITDTLKSLAEGHAERMRIARSCAELIHDCHAQGIRVVAAHVFHGLPGQTGRELSEFLTTITAARPHRIIEHGREHLGNLMPQPVAGEDLLRTTVEQLEAAGYHRTSIHQFVLPDVRTGLVELRPEHHRNFLGLDMRGDCDLLGFGAGAFSQIADCYSQNAPDLRAWEAALDEGRLAVHRGLWLSEEDVIRMELTLQLMLHGEITIDTIEHVHRLDFGEHFADAMKRLEPMADNGLVSIGPTRITVTEKGRQWLRRIAMCFEPPQA